MKKFNKNKAIRKINLQQNKSTYIKRLSMSLSCFLLLLCALLLTFAKFETSSDEMVLINGELKNYYDVGHVWNFDYTGSYQEFNVPRTGVYKLEVWGAQGGGNVSYDYSIGGTGGYSVGNISLNSNTSLYLQIGGNSNNGHSQTYNGGGLGSPGGGGATSVTTTNRGQLSAFSNNVSEVLIVAGGGGGDDCVGQGGHGGGYIGGSSKILRTDRDLDDSFLADGGTQSAGGDGYVDGSFGQGGGFTQYAQDHTDLGGGGGGGYYGGGAGRQPAWSSGGGGSGYIGNSLLSNKHMACYECSESNAVSTKTIAVSCKNSTPIADCAKEGHGYARITLLSKN